MFGKHIKAASLVLVLCLIAVMFFLAAILSGEYPDVANSVGAVVLLVFVAAAIIPVFVAHERHN